MRTIVLLLSAILAGAAFPDFESAVLTLTGASCLEELDESTVEHYRALERHPLDLNAAGRSRLLASGLMTPFQAASLLDWRGRSGDILSYEELALIDGFSPEYADALKPFTRIESRNAPGEVHTRRLHHDVVLKASAKENDGVAASGGLKYKVSFGERAELNWSTRTTYSSPAIGIGTLSAAYYGQRHIGKIVLGHFNARFGQGLGLWSGMSMSPFSGVSSMRRNGTGFTPTGSFSPGHCGVAADFCFGRWTGGAAFSVQETMPMGFVSYTARSFTAGVSLAPGIASADFRINIKGGGIFGEIAWNEGLSAALGTVWIPSYGNKLSALFRWVEGKPELGAGCAIGAFEGMAAWYKGSFRSYLKCAPEIQAGPLTLKPSLRLAARYQNSWRLDGRGELRAGMKGWVLNSRLDVVHGESIAWLLNAEAGRQSEKLRAWVRWTLFCVDEWADRIYVYERDAPGNFNVPAYYGRGWSLSVTGGWKMSRKQSLHVRVSLLEYPWMSIEKPSKYEVKLQYQVSI